MEGQPLLVQTSGMLRGAARERAGFGLLLLAAGLLQSACSGGATAGCTGAEVVGSAVVATVVDGTTEQPMCDATVTASVGSAMFARSGRQASARPTAIT